MDKKKFRKIITAITAVIICTAVLRLPLSAEFVFLKDGLIESGAIISDSAASVTIRTSDKKKKQIPRKDIMRILYTELKMGKVYIQKRDGEGIVAYIVDEDRLSYTFRKDLYKPAEFVLNRGDVLFISEKNPSGLKVDGEIGTDNVSLSWLPPYETVKKYNVYITKNKTGRYEVFDSTAGKSVTLKNLLSNTTYYIIVTSVDSDDYESPPSNEIKITTKNMLPMQPVISSYEKTGSGDRKIKWGASVDPDGKVEKYRIYGLINDKREIIAEVKHTEYYLKNASLYDKVDVTAVDDRGGESAAVTSKSPDRVTVLEIYPGTMFPVGKFGKMFGVAYGGELSLSERNLFFENFEAGVNIGFYSMQGKDLLDEKNKDYDKMMLAPGYLTAGYNIMIGDSFSIKPVLSFGGAYVGMKYYDRNRTAAEGRDRDLSIFEPAFKAGLSAEYRFTDYLLISAGCAYGAVVEKSGMLNFILVNAGIGFSF